MSKLSIKQKLADKLLYELSSEANKIVRKGMQRGRAHILDLSDLTFITATIDALLSNVSEEDENGKKTDLKAARTTAEKAIQNNNTINQCRDIAEASQSRYLSKKNKSRVNDTTEYKYLQSVRPEIAANLNDGKAFLLGSFSTIGTIKKKIVTHILGKGNPALQNILRNVDRGHGASGGDAVAHVQAARAATVAAKGGINLANTPGLEDFLTEKFKEQNIDLSNVEVVKRVLVDYQQLVTRDGIKARYVPVIVLQDFLSNRGLDSKEEKAILKFLGEFIENTLAKEDGFIDLKGSPTTRSLIEDKVLFDITKGLTKAKITGIKRKAPKGTSKQQAKSNELANATASVTTVAASRAKFKNKKRTTKKATSSEFSMVNLIGMINQNLPRTVEKNMGAPRLINQTGTFAASTRITDIVKTTKGFPSIGYTYQLSPYQTFEPGFRQGSQQRDPRKLIDASIREIAAQFAIGRFYTRRV